MRVWVQEGFCASGHDTYAYRMFCMYVHVGGVKLEIFQGGAVAILLLKTPIPKQILMFVTRDECVNLVCLGVVCTYKMGKAIRGCYWAVVLRAGTTHQRSRRNRQHKFVNMNNLHRRFFPNRKW